MNNCTLAALALASAACALTQARPPAYDGGFPSMQSQLALAGLFNKVWRDQACVISSQTERRADGSSSVRGGSWEVVDGGVSPHPLGPGSLEGSEVDADTQGPHVILRNGPVAVFLPTRCDSDVAALLRLFGCSSVAGVKSDRVSPAFRAAMERVRGFGEAVRGLRVGACASERPGEVLVQVWNTGSHAQRIDCAAKLELAPGPRIPGDTDGPFNGGPAGPPTFTGFSIPIPPRASPSGSAARGFFVDLQPGCVYEERVTVSALAVRSLLRQVGQDEGGGSVARDFYVRASLHDKGPRPGGPRNAPDSARLGRWIESEVRLVRLREAESRAR